MRSCGIHLRAISWWVPKLILCQYHITHVCLMWCWFCVMSLNIIFEITAMSPRANELNLIQVIACYLIAPIHFVDVCTFIRDLSGYARANERRCYYVTSSLIGWAHAQNNPWFMINKITRNTPHFISKHTSSGPWFNIKIPSYQYRKFQYGDKTILRLSHLHSGNSYTGKIISL